MYLPPPLQPTLGDTFYNAVIQKSCYHASGNGMRRERLQSYFPWTWPVHLICLRFVLTQWIIISEPREKKERQQPTEHWNSRLPGCISAVIHSSSTNGSNIERAKKKERAHETTCWHRDLSRDVTQKKRKKEVVGSIWMHLVGLECIRREIPRVSWSGLFMIISSAGTDGWLQTWIYFTYSNGLGE